MHDQCLRLQRQVEAGCPRSKPNASKSPGPADRKPGFMNNESPGWHEALKTVARGLAGAHASAAMAVNIGGGPA